MAKLKLYQSNIPKGSIVEVFPYGEYENWNEYDVDALDEDLTIGDPDGPEPTSINDMEFKVVLPGPSPLQDQVAEPVAPSGSMESHVEPRVESPPADTEDAPRKAQAAKKAASPVRTNNTAPVDTGKDKEA